MKKSLEYCYKNFLGSGNPNANYWFFGFEPGGNPLDNEYLNHLMSDSEKDFIEYSQDYSNEKVEPGLLTQLFTLFLKLKLNLSFKNKPTERKICLSPKVDVFYSNLFLLKFPSETNKNNDLYLQSYKEYFDIKVNTSSRKFLYPEYFLLQRKKLFEKYLDSPKIIFVLKKGWKQYYYKLLGLNDIDEINFPYDKNNIDKCDIYRSGKHLIIFMKNGRFSYDGISQVLLKINEL